MRADFERWLSETPAGDEVSETPAGDEVRRRMWSLWLDMQEHIRQTRGDSADAWKLAALVVWWHMPKRLRQPRHESELAALLDTSDRALRRWKVRHAELFVQAGQRVWESLVRDNLSDVIDAAITSAVEGGAQGHADRKMLLEIGNVYRPKTTTAVTSGVQVYLPENGRG